MPDQDKNNSLILREKITMENQAKKRKGGAENLRDKKTSPALDKVLPIEKLLCLFYTSLKY